MATPQEASNSGTRAQAQSSRPQPRPGISLAGAVDLSSLKHQVSAKPGQQGGAPAAGGYVIDVSAESFQSVVESSRTYLVLLYVWVADDDRLFDFTRKLQDAVNKLDGKIQLARIDAKKYPDVPQALGIAGAPALVAVIGGRPIPVTQGLPGSGEEEQILALLPKLVQVATRAGVTGTAPKMDADSDSDSADGSDGADSDAQKEQIPPEHQKAHELAMQHDYAGAALEYKKVLENNPDDHIAARERAKALLLARSGDADVKTVRDAAASKPDDVDAQLAVADVDMIGGKVDDAFSRLLDFIASHPAKRDEARERLLSYFPLFEASDPRVSRARRRLAVLLY